MILHAHLDAAGRWFEPREAGGRVYGRGACDSKGQIAVLIVQAMLLGELRRKFPEAASPRLYQFTLDGGIGGNGSIAAASDARLAGTPVLMHEPTGLAYRDGHFGRVYYRCELSIGRNGGTTAVELYPFVVLALESEGRKIQRETNHPAFTAEQVQTSHGILGPYGHHPGVVCDHVAVDVVAYTNAHPDRLAMKLTQYLDEALLEYFRRYGDKSQGARHVGRTQSRPAF